MGILYKLKFATGKIYIGVTESDSMSRRLGQHRYKAKTGSKLPVHLAWKKHGEPEAEILAFYYGESLYKMEIEAIAKFSSLSPNGYNVLNGGQKSPALNKDVAKKISESTKTRYKDPRQIEKARELAKNRSEETRKKISQALTGKKLSEATKEKIKDANLGKKHTSETKAKMSNAHKGKKYSEETLENMRVAAQKRMQSPEAKAQLKAASVAGGNATKLKAKNKQILGEI